MSALKTIGDLYVLKNTEGSPSFLRTSRTGWNRQKQITVVRSENSLFRIMQLQNYLVTLYFEVPGTRPGTNKVCYFEIWILTLARFSDRMEGRWRPQSLETIWISGHEWSDQLCKNDQFYWNSIVIRWILQLIRLNSYQLFQTISNSPWRTAQPVVPALVSQSDACCA